MKHPTDDGDDAHKIDVSVGEHDIAHQIGLQSVKMLFHFLLRQNPHIARTNKCNHWFSFEDTLSIGML